MQRSLSNLNIRGLVKDTEHRCIESAFITGTKIITQRILDIFPRGQLVSECVSKTKDSHSKDTAEVSKDHSCK